VKKIADTGHILKTGLPVKQYLIFIT